MRFSDDFLNNFMDRQYRCIRMVEAAEVLKKNQVGSYRSLFIQFI